MDALQDSQVSETIDRYSREQNRLLTQFKDTQYVSDEKPIQTQLECVSGILKLLLRLRTLRRVIAEKGD